MSVVRPPVFGADHSDDRPSCPPGQGRTFLGRERNRRLPTLQRSTRALLSGRLAQRVCRARVGTEHHGDRHCAGTLGFGDRGPRRSTTGGQICGRPTATLAVLSGSSATSRTGPPRLVEGRAAGDEVVRRYGRRSRGGGIGDIGCRDVGDAVGAVERPQALSFVPTVGVPPGWVAVVAFTD